MSQSKNKKNSSSNSSASTAEPSLFDRLDTFEKDYLLKNDLLNYLGEMGILTDDPRLIESMKVVAGLQGKDKINRSTFERFTRKSKTLVKKTLEGRLVIPAFAEFCADLEAIYLKTKENRGGNVATYIPQLARVDGELFGFSVCTVDGQRFSIGDSDHYFCVQSSCKPINYCAVLQDVGETVVHRHVGREPSGRSFNELALNAQGLPHNPLINSGAIMSCSLLKKELCAADRFDYVLKLWSELAGGKSPRFNNAVYLSERQTADRNFALGYFMKEQGAFPAGIDLTEVLEFYFQCCSIEVNCEMMSVVAATLADAGVCPLTGERVLNPDVVKNCLSLMSSCGMYDFSGEFAFKIGLPAKSGISGVVMLVVPNVAGICIWSPRLDDLGNSVRAVEFCKELVNLYNFHTYDSLILGYSDKKDPRFRKYEQTSANITILLWAASSGDLPGVAQVVATNLDINAADYDGRTALHLASSEGHIEVVRYLLQCGACVERLDRWGHSALDDARRQGDQSLIELLEKRLLS